MTKWSAYVAAGVSALALTILIGCSREGTESTSSPSGGRPRVALIMKARTNPFFERMAAGASQAGKDLGADVLVLDVDKETDTAGQAAKVETAAASGVQVILIAPADSKAIVAPLLQAQRRGIKIINLDNRIDAEAAKKAGLKIETFIGPDNVEGARKSTAALIERIGGEGNIAMLEGIRGVDNAESRKRGCTIAVQDTAGKVSIVAMDTAEWATEPAQKKMESILNTRPDIKGVFCANDMMALGAIQAIASAGRTSDVIVTGYDNLEAAKAALRAGTLHATIEQHPDLMGRMGVEAALKLIQGESLPPQIDVPTDLVTADTLAAE